MAEKQKILKKWIDLNDPYGAKLKIGRYNNKLVLVITGVRPRSQNFHKAINELGFLASGTGAYLVKAVEITDRITTGMFHPIWPRATMAMMDPADYTLDLSSVRDRLKKRAEERANAKTAEEIDAEKRALQESVTNILSRSTYLGRNAQGIRVFGGVTGRFTVSDTDEIVNEDASKPSPVFLRSSTQSDIRECAKGLLRAAELGESQNLNKLLGFAGSVLQKELDAISMDEREMIAQAIDSAMLESLVQNNETAGKAWADAAYYQEMMPGRAELAPDSHSTPYLPAPIAVQVQRFLTSANAVNVNGKIPGFGFGMLSDSTRVFVEDPDTLEWGSQTYHRPMVEHAAEQDIPADGGYWRISGNPGSVDYEEFFSSLAADAIAVVTAGEQSHLLELEKHARLIQSIKIPTWLSGTSKPIYIFAMKKGAGQEERQREPAPVTSWDDLKTVVDETLLLMGKEAEANEKINLKSERTENQLQRPYLAASRVGEASTMVPRNLQSALGFALSRLEENNGNIDQYVSAELGIGFDTMSERLSPEQVDAIGLAIDRIYSGRGFILGDETGIGKGRTIASVAAWGARLGKRIIFVTDRANLFSDLGRDLIDIGEWERFRPLITNSDGKILDIMGNGEEIAQPLTAAELRRAMEMDPKELPANIIFTTYSQLNSESSDKARWLQELSQDDALLILDEAHIAAGSDSNTAKQIQAMVDNSWGVIYSSATWAKSSKNLHIYSRALPESVNITQVISAMKSEGETFGEVFSSMLAMDGALIRREHDLSKVDFVVDVDNVYTERNKQIAGQVSEILGMMAMISGEINHMLQRMSGATRSALMTARTARQTINQSAQQQRQEIEHNRISLASQLRSAEDYLVRTIHALAQVNGVQDEEIDEGYAPNLRDQAALEHLQQGLSQPGPLSPEQRTEAERVRLELRIHEIQQNIESLRAQLNEANSAVDPQVPQAATPTKLFSSNFGTGGAIYQVMRRTIAALSVDYTADRIIQSAQEGRKPVVVLEETGESFVRQLINDEIERIQDEIRSMREREARGELTAADQTTREIAEMLDTGVRPSEVVRQVRAPNIQDMLRQLVARLGGIKIVEASPSSDDADKGVVTTVAYTNLADLPDVSEDVVQKYMDGIQELNEKINALPKLPLIHFDALRVKMEKAGLRVGEISGRHHALNPIDGADSLNGTLELVKRARKKSDVTQTAAHFNAGNHDVVLINVSAATGMSLHSSPRFSDTRQRELFEMQHPEDTTKRIQLFGRVNRFDQLMPPRISIMNTGLKSEIRATITANQKLKKMSANVRASQDNAALIEDVPDLLNRTGDKVCQEFLLENPGVASRLDIQMDKIRESYGLANIVTQRLALLGLDEYDRVYAGLCEAYEDALLADKIAMSGDSIIMHDWRARMIRQRHAWGPTQHIEALSAFDSPVLERVVEYVEDFQPYHWQDVRDRIVESTQRLIQDERVKPQHILSVAPDHAGAPVFESTLRTEQGLSKQERHNHWAGRVMDSLVMALPTEAIEGDDIDADAARPIVHDLEENDGQEELGLLEPPTLKRVPKGFEAIAGHWVATEARIPGSRITQRMMALVSRSGKSAKMWFLNEKGEARQFYINLDKAIKGDHAQMGAAIKELELVTGISDESWQRLCFNQVWGSIDPEVHLLDTSEVANRAKMLLEAKKIMGLQQTGLASIEEAISHPDHNAVKEAHFRSLFFENVITHLVPGVELTLRDKEKKANLDFFGDNRMVVLDVEVPESPHEASLSKWKFHMAMPGHQEAVILSGAMLFKMAGFAPGFNNIFVGHNLFEGIGWDMEVAARSFNRFTKGERTMRKTLLVGNMFQAGEWARASKRGRPILYTDESGQTHRAIEVLSKGFFDSMVDFPMRLHNRGMIRDFVGEIMDPNAPAHAAAQIAVFTSFRGALAAQQSTSGTSSNMDRMIFDRRANALAWFIDKGEKEKVRRSLRSAVKADRSRWEQENPDTPYPVQFSTHAPRTSSSQYTQLTIKLPETPVGLARFMDLLTKTQGLEIFALRSHPRAYEAACNAERKHYERLAQPALAEQARKRSIVERRQTVQKMLDTALNRDTAQAPTNDAKEVPGGEYPQQTESSASVLPALEQGDQDRNEPDPAVHESDVTMNTSPRTHISPSSSMNN